MRGPSPALSAGLTAGGAKLEEPTRASSAEDSLVWGREPPGRRPEQGWSQNGPAQVAEGWSEKALRGTGLRERERDLLAWMLLRVKAPAGPAWKLPRLRCRISAATSSLFVSSAKNGSWGSLVGPGQGERRLSKPQRAALLPRVPVTFCGVWRKAAV